MMNVLRKMSVCLMILGSSYAVSAQTFNVPSKPILSAEADAKEPFYDRLGRRMKIGEPPKMTKAQVDSIAWLAGKWTMKGKGYARALFKGAKQFEWEEPAREFFFDGNQSIYMAVSDSTIFRGNEGEQKINMPPQLFLQYDTYSRLWVLKGGYDWGSLVSNGWMKNTISFRGTVSLRGFKINQRQTWIKVNNDEFVVKCEERLSNGTWFLFEENVYRRVK